MADVKNTSFPPKANGTPKAAATPAAAPVATPIPAPTAPPTEAELTLQMQAAVKSGDYKQVAKVAGELVKFQKLAEAAALEAKQKVLAEKTDTVTRAVPDGVKLDDYLSQLGASRVHQNCRGRVPAVRVGFIVNMTHEVHLRRGVLINDDPTSKAIWSGANGSIGWTTLAKSRLRPLLESSPEIHSN